ncbi:MAG: hemerythrin [Burkholderiales bacterium]|nr:MAG: hemerythrin [Burkholderiales bacterium]
MSDTGTPQAAEPVIGWSDAFVLGHEPMDATHREFVALVRAMQTGPEEALPGLLEAFETHARRHFADEDRWMVETGFPPRDCHIDEHAAVLRSVVQVREVVARGETGQVRRLADALADWFPGHADWLDSALAHWLCKRAYGGKPVVLRRDLKAAAAEIRTDPGGTVR